MDENGVMLVLFKDALTSIPQGEPDSAINILIPESFFGKTDRVYETLQPDSGSSITG